MKSSSGVGGILALLFILGAIVLAISLVNYIMSVQERLRELHEERVQAVIESIELSRSLQSFWLFQKGVSILTINITNMYSKPVSVVSGIIIYYDKTYDLLYGDLRERLGNRVIMVRLYYAGKLVRVWPGGLGFKLPFWLNPGYTLSITINTNGREPLTVKFASATVIALCVVTGQQYTPRVIILPTPTPTSRFRVRLNITSHYTRLERPFDIGFDFSKLPINSPYTIDPESIIIADTYSGESTSKRLLYKRECILVSTPSWYSS